MEIFKNLLKFYHQVFSTIAKTKFFGWLYLDSALHLLVGIILMLLLMRWKRIKTPTHAFIIILSLELVKEGLDSFSLTASWHEAISDTLITMSYPSIVVAISYLKKK